MKTALLLGTTGMLKEAATHAALKAERVVLASRRANDFSFGSDSLDKKIIRIPQSYEDEEEFFSAIRPYAPFNMALTWIRPRAEKLRIQIDEMMAPGGTLIEVMGSRSLSADGEMSPIAELRTSTLSRRPDVSYAQLVLGFIKEGETSRWLTHEEISSAAIAQIELPLPRRIAGELEPWNMRPR